MVENKTPNLFKSFVFVALAIVIVLGFAPFVFFLQVVSLSVNGGVSAFIYNIAVSLDQLGNTLLRGNPDHTISERLGRALVAKKYGCCEWRVKLCRFLDWAFNENGHCFDSIDKRDR